MPVTAHPAFDKAAEYLCVKLVKIDLDPNTLRVDLNKVKRAINSNTILVIGSAPNYPHGVVDDIEGLSHVLEQVDARHGARVGRIGLHVDSCLGGFVLPWALREGHHGVPTFDFAVARVTSISADTHKYGFAPKASSSYSAPLPPLTALPGHECAVVPRCECARAHVLRGHGLVGRHLRLTLAGGLTPWRTARMHVGCHAVPR